MSTDAPTLADATAAELPAIAAALAAAGLPSGDLGLPNRRFFCLRDRQGALIGFAGLELHGSDALLRSVVVLPARRRRGFGRAMVTAMLDRARALGARRVFLLTTDAQAFFAGLGFTPMSRGDAPPCIAATAEFTGLCPASATCMTKAVALPP